MASRYYSVVLFALVALFNYDVTEARSWGSDGNPLASTNNGNPLSKSPALENILELIFQSRGTSLDQILASLSTANGDVGSAVSQVNSGLNTDILKIDGNLLKLDPGNVKELLKESLGSLVNNGLPNNPELASIVGNGINEQLDSQSQQITSALDNIALPVDTAQELLENDTQNRKRRSLQPREALDLGTVISDIVLSVLQDQLYAILANLLESVKNFLLQFYTSTPPENEIESVIVFAKNTIIQKAVELLTVLQQTVQAPADSTTESATARRKREVETATAGETGNEDGTVETSSGGLLDFIVRPILTILASLLSPVNSLVKSLVAVISSLLRPVLGDLLLDPIGNLLNAIIDLLLPSTQV